MILTFFRDEQLFDLQVPSELRYGTSLLEEEGRIFLSLVFHRRAFQYFSEYGGYIEHVLTVFAECRIRKGMYFTASGAYVSYPLCVPFRVPAMSWCSYHSPYSAVPDCHPSDGGCKTCQGKVPLSCAILQAGTFTVNAA